MLENESYRILRKNHITSNSDSYCIPASDYKAQFFWDSCFHSIVLRHFNIEWAREEILSLLKHQYGNGKIPHMVFRRTPRACPGFLHEFSSREGDVIRSHIIQPPNIAYAVLKIYEESRDIGFLRKTFPGLNLFYNYLKNERDIKNEDLISIIHMWESGKDDSVKWDKLLGYKINPTKEQLMRHKKRILSKYREMGYNDRRFIKGGNFEAKGIAFNSIYARNLLSMARISEILRDKESLGTYQSRYEKTRSAMRRKMWVKKDMLFSTLYFGGKNRVTEKVSSIFSPLFGGILNREEARELIERHLLNEEEFWCKYPVPTVSLDNKKFDPNRYWRGTTWININWIINTGLVNYGFFDISKELVKKTIGLIKENGFWEYYNPLNGNGLGVKNLSWSTLVVDMQKELRRKEVLFK